MWRERERQRERRKDENKRDTCKTIRREEEEYFVSWSLSYTAVCPITAVKLAPRAGRDGGGGGADISPRDVMNRGATAIDGEGGGEAAAAAAAAGAAAATGSRSNVVPRKKGSAPAESVEQVRRP